MIQRKFLILSDIQAPSHDVNAVAAVADFAMDWKPDSILCVGDEADSPEPSRWNRGYAAEYGRTLQDGLDAAADVMLRFRRSVGDGPEFHVMRSNHGERIQKYVARYAPALAGLRALEYEALLRYDEAGVTYHTKPFPFAPGWLLAHGDEGGSSQGAGGTALQLAKKWGRSVVAGHTHKQGVQHWHQGFNGKVNRQLFGVETGHLMDMRKAGYLGAGYGNWQQGFAVAYQFGRNATVHNIPIVDRSFVVEGVEYRW